MTNTLRKAGLAGLAIIATGGMLAGCTTPSGDGTSSEKPFAILGVDADFYDTDETTRPYLLTSVLKKIDTAVYDTVLASAAGEFSSEAYLGTFANGGVGIAPFHDLEPLVDPALQGELDALAEDIVAGEVEVESYLSEVATSGDAAAEPLDPAGITPAEGFLPCLVGDTAGFNDNSFNELAHNGIETAAADLGVEFKALESADDTAYAPNIANLVAEGCTLIFTVGFNLEAAGVESANANPGVQYAQIDDDGDTTFDGVSDAVNGNFKPILFNTAEAAFLGGYAAASFTTSGIVGTYGGAPFPTVSIFMDGFAQGVDYYNSTKEADVQVLGWDRDAQDGSFVSSDPAIAFSPGPLPLAIVQGFLDQGADVIFPVGGAIYQSAIAAIEAAE